MSHKLDTESQFEFSNILEAKAFETVLEQTNTCYTKQHITETSNISSNNAEMLFTIEKEQEVSLVAFDIFNGHFDDYELNQVIQMKH